jgi:hypothetical protein
MSTKQYITEESIWTSWGWKAFREFLYIAGIFLLMFFLWFFTHREKPIFEIIKDIQNLRFPQDYYIFAILTGAGYLLRLLSLTKQWRNKAKTLFKYQGVPGVIRIGKFEIKIENDLMLLKKKGFLKSRSWKERKSEFLAVRLSGEYVHRSDENFDYYKYIVELLHVKQFKSIILCKDNILSDKEFISIRKTWKETARALGLPAIEPYPLGSLWRGVQDIDKPIRNLAKENKISFDFKIDSHLPRHSELSQKNEELTIICGCKMIISPTLMKIGRIIIPFGEIQHIGTLRYTKSHKTYHTLVVASDSKGFFVDRLSVGQIYWLERLILAGACGKLKNPIYLE